MVFITNSVAVIAIILLSIIVFVKGVMAFYKFVFKWDVQADEPKISASYKDMTFDLLAQKDDNIFPPSIKAYQALYILKIWLLGEDWYVVNPVSGDQVNAETVHAILMQYSKEYKKELELRRIKK